MPPNGVQAKSFHWPERRFSGGTESVAKHAEILTVSAWQAEVEAPLWVKAGQLVLGEIYYRSLCR